MVTETDTNREKLQKLLRELFQFDAADLDFGVYRVLNQRRDRIEGFIEEDLLDAVSQGLDRLHAEDTTELELELQEKRQIVEDSLGGEVFTEDGDIKEQFRELKAAREYLDLRAHLAGIRERAEAAEETEARIFNDLYRFFSRYFESGDFHTKRRFSGHGSKFHIPYDGEEVFFHWANKDQYYIKTSELFTDYRFQLDGLSVEFQLDAAEVPQDDVKGDSRYFLLSQPGAVAFEPELDLLTIAFQYRPITETEETSILETYNEATGEKRKSLAHSTNQILCKALEVRILSEVESTGLREKLTTPAGEGGSQSSLLSQLQRYTAKHTMDYFIHKDLEAFLRGELDFFLKNEVLDVGELLSSPNYSHSSRSVTRARVIQEIAEEIIRFIGQIEDFQRRLFEKRKFVLQTDYLVTLDRVPDDLYDQILANDDQIAAWHRVYNLEEWEHSLLWNGSVNRSFLDNHPHLMIDTGLFDPEFKFRVLSSIENLEEETDGVLIHGENFQALNLLSERYRNRARAIYIDPPYNTGNDEFLYKDRFRHSSWLSMVNDRIRVSKSLLDHQGLFFSSIDENEVDHYLHALSQLFEERVSIVAVRNNPKGRSLDRYLSTSHEYLLSFAQERVELEGLEKSDEQLEEYSSKDERGRYRTHNLRNTHRQFNRETRPNLWYPLYVDPKSNDVRIQPQADEIEVFPVWDDGLEGCWTWSRERAAENLHLLEASETNGTWKIYRKDYAAGATYTPKTIWDDTELRTDFAQRELDSLFGERAFRSPKPSKLIERAVQLSSSGAPFVCDFFAGSGTTAEAVIRLNDRQEGRLRYLLVEFGEHFDDVLKPRIQKLCFSLNWEDGVPQDQEGRPQLVRYSRIESYEDSLANIRLFTPEGSQQTLLEDDYGDYFTGYMIDFESRGSQGLLPEGALQDPFSFELRVSQDGTHPEPTEVDLVETFHYLIGAEVKRYKEEEHQGRRYVVTYCEARTGTGTDTLLTVWRAAEGLDLDKEAEWIEDSFGPSQYDRVYINTESFVTNAEPIEIVFRERMEAPPRVE